MLAGIFGMNLKSTLEDLDHRVLGRVGAHRGGLRVGVHRDRALTKSKHILMENQ
jgi:hypothetical protein